MPMPAVIRANKRVGSPTPRLFPPQPLRSGVKDYVAVAESIGLHLYPWQKTAGKYLTALGPNGKWLYREVAVIVARQNGKTTLLVPLIVQRLLDGQSIMHTAQNAKLPREVHELVAVALQAHYPDKLPKKRSVSYAVGHEEIRLTNGGKYRIVAPTKGGARGPSNDLVIVDELREMDDDAFIGAAKPTLTVSKKPQMIYLSNAGTETSVVLNAVKSRADVDPVLAYLEWSAPPDLPADDVSGWLMANPTIGHDPSVLETLEIEFRSNTLAGSLAIFETEHLCRWVATMRERLIDDYSWVRCKADTGTPVRPVIAVSMDPKGRRASVALAWRGEDAVSLRLLLNVTGDPVNTDELGKEIRQLVAKYRPSRFAFDPMTDKELIKYVTKPKPEPVAGSLFSNQSSTFARIVEAGKLRHSDCDPVTDDLTWTALKPDGEGAYHAVRASDDRPITASLAAIRAVGLASGPPQPVARVY